MTATLELTADYEAARAIGPWLTQTLEDLKAPHAERVGELELAIHELAINIVDHAYDDTSRPGATYTIGLHCEDDELIASFSDHGCAYVDERQPKGDEPTIRGYGLIIVEQLASKVTYERVGSENRWTLVFASN